MRQLKQSPIFRSFLISYVVILIIPLLTGFISYNVSSNIIKSSSVEASRMLLNQSKDIVDRQMSEVESFTRQLAMNQDLNYLLNAKPSDETHNVYAMWKTWRDTSVYSATNTFLQNFYIYLDNYNVVFTPSSVFVRPDNYYDLYHYQDLDRNEWKNQILNKIHQREIIPDRPYVDNGRSTSVITYLQSLPLDSFQHSLGTAVILIDESEISKMLKRVSDQYGGWACIYDKDGNIISSMGVQKKYIKELQQQGIGPSVAAEPLIKDDSLLISTKSDLNGWVYVVGLPKQTVLKKTYFIGKVTWAITGSTLLIGIIVALLLAYRNSAPITGLLTVFREQVGQTGYKGKNAYDFLHGNISHLIANHKSMEEELKRQLPLLEDAFLKRLLKGEFDSSHEVRAVMSSLALDPGLMGEFGYVGLIRINGYSGLVSKEIYHELNAARLIIRRGLQELSGLAMKITDLDSDKLAVVFTFSQEPGEREFAQIEELFDVLRNYVKAEYRIQLTAAVGNDFKSFSDISRSFDQARQALDLAVLMKNHQTLWYRDAAKGSTDYYYPIDLELRMMNAVKIGELEEVNRIFQQLIEQNFVDRHLSADTVRRLFGEMKGTLFKLLQQNPFACADIAEPLKIRVEQLQLSDSLDRLREEMISLFEAFCNQVIKKKKDDSGEIIRTIVEFLETHYSDADLNLYRVSEAAGLPEKYISQLFKEQTGENLSDYLEQIRIKTATDLLFNSSQTIDEISHNVGYNSAHAFRRAFKRVSGVSPSIYRKTVH